MVIHIVNGCEREKLTFLQFIRKSEQLSRAILPAGSQLDAGPRRSGQSLRQIDHANRPSKIENETGPAWIRTRDQGIMSPLLYR